MSGVLWARFAEPRPPLGTFYSALPTQTTPNLSRSKRGHIQCVPGRLLQLICIISTGPFPACSRDESSISLRFHAGVGTDGRTCCSRGVAEVGGADRIANNVAREIRWPFRIFHFRRVPMVTLLFVIYFRLLTPPSPALPITHHTTAAHDRRLRRR